MKIWVKPYIKRNGEMMVYLNNDRKVSLGICGDYKSSKATVGQKNLWEAFCNAVVTSEPIAIGADMSAHNEWKMTLFNEISFAITDIGSIGGVSTGSDGFFIVWKDKVFKPQFKTN